MGIYILGEEMGFPPAELAGKDGLLALEGDLSPERLLEAYRNGIFPWYNEDSPILWWSPDPRMVLMPKDFKVKKSFRNTLNKNIYTTSFDTDFEGVIRACAGVERKGQEGTWITGEMIAAYSKLHKMGYGHSVETYHEGKLVGGLYGVSLGRAFFGESMFHNRQDASKTALFRLTEKLRKWDFDFIDVQQDTSHLRSLGARSIPRKKYLSLLKESLKNKTRKGRWTE
ncbi:MAG: leucyl/phenylalanyl-tRNA--protein transferase [Bacteroidota bacterium]|nr:leucyl/phenylalanyl-tRNA--protein transferase [Bacteroidota bacterium]